MENANSTILECGLILMKQEPIKTDILLCTLYYFINCTVYTIHYILYYIACIDRSTIVVNIFELEVFCRIEHIMTIDY